jgi:hypothetical protein
VWEPPNNSFPDAGVDTTTSFWKFQIRLTEEMGEELGEQICPDAKNCILVSPTMYDNYTQIGRSDPHVDGDMTDEYTGADVCLAETANSCLPLGPNLVKDDDFEVLPADDNEPFDEGPEGTREVHTQILSLDMKACQFQEDSQPVGPIQFKRLKLNPEHRSIGEVESLGITGSDFPGEGFFNLFVEATVDMGAGDVTLFNKIPLLLENQEIDKFPPSDWLHYDHTNAVVVFYKDDEGKDQELGWIEVASHATAFPYINKYCDESEDVMETLQAFEDHFEERQKDPKKPRSLSVTLDSFTATASNGEVALEWATGTEKDNAKFVVWRYQSLDGTCSTEPNNYTDVQTVGSSVASQGTEVSGATYNVTDSNVVYGNTYCYVLEDVEYDGDSIFHWNDIVSATSNR